MHYQPFLINMHAADTIISSEQILQHNHRFALWQQEGHKVSSASTSGQPGSLTFFALDGTPLLFFPLERKASLYCSSPTTLIPRTSASMGALAHTVTAAATPSRHIPHRPVARAQQLLSELWALPMGHCNDSQLQMLPKCVDGTPTVFTTHPFRFDDTKERVCVQKQASGTIPSGSRHQNNVSLWTLASCGLLGWIIVLQNLAWIMWWIVLRAIQPTSL
jgi:hypothetical protein